MLSQDCLTAVQWVKKFIWSFGGDRSRISIVGESSGGNLALSTGAARVFIRELIYSNRVSSMIIIILQ